MLTIYTGRARLLTGALIHALRGAPSTTQLVVVPKQLTLQTERTLLEALNLRGSFRLQVLSAERLCGRIFDAAGLPGGERIDDRGRVMLVRAAVRAAGPELTLYRGAEHRRGFPERAAQQLERIRQARVTGETLRACAAKLSGSARMKLNDLSHILEAYETLIEGRYQDGEAEFSAAIVRARDAAFLRDCGVWFFGFDMVPPTLHELMAAVAAVCPCTGVFVPMENDQRTRDFDAFLPMQRALERLAAAALRMQAKVARVDVEEEGLVCDPAAQSANRPGHALNIAEMLAAKSAGAPPADFGTSIAEAFFQNRSRSPSPLDRITDRRRLTLPGPARRDDLRALERELFAYPAQPGSGPARAVQLTLLRDPLEECRFAAALTRRLVRQRGWRWDDVLILCRDPERYAAPLRAAFGEYEIPLFLASSRSAARHATAECLLTALKVIEKNYPAEDMLALMRTGLMPVSGDEADRFANYIVRTGLRGSRFLRPLRRGSEAELEAMEPIRARLAEPIVRLRDRLRRAESLPDQLTALFGFLTDVDAYARSLDRMNRLAEAGLREAAGEEGQVWNRILGALDQMHALMGTAKLSLRELSETLTESLSASVIKSLPQSGDAVYVQSAESACTRTAKAILLLGMADRPASDDEGLLTPGQKQALCEFTGAYLGPDDADLSRLRRFYLKSALGMASDYVSVSCPLSGSDGAAQRPSAVFEMIEALFPGTKTRGGVTGDPGVERMLRGAPAAAALCAARALAGVGEGVPAPESDRAALAGLARIARDLPRAQESLARLSAALNRAHAADSLTPATARQLYGALHRQSVTRLELFAACPFSYYAKYGLCPDRVEPFELNARDEGTFFHSAVNEFLLRSMDDLNHLDAETAALRMDAISDVLLDAMSESGPLGDSAVSAAERRRLKSTARTCAAALADHMRGSRFHTSSLEQSFGREDGALALSLPGNCVLEGRIDRVDAWNGSVSGDAPADYLRVIDFKRGGKALKLCEAYYGLRLQLPVYLAAAQRRWGGLSAGVYYFTLDEGILATQTVDPAAVDAQRRKAFRMEGLLPDSPDLLKAMSPDVENVLKLRLTAAGTPYKGAVLASERDFANLTRCALRRAAEHLERIRSGVCAPAPARIDQSTPCKTCDARLICQFDDRLDAQNIRKYKPIGGEEVLERLRAEGDGDGE